MISKIFSFSLFVILLSCNSIAQKAEIIQDPTSHLYGIKLGKKQIVSPQYISIDLFNNCGISGATHPNGNYYYINTKGERLDVSPFIEEYQTDKFVEGMARYLKNAKVGFINECGEIAIPAAYQFAYPFHNGISVVRKGFKKVKITPEYIKNEGGKYGAIDKKGNLIIPFDFDYIGLFEQNKTAIAKKNGKEFIINRKGHKILFNEN